jgi:hypothetical protein
MTWSWRLPVCGRRSYERERQAPVSWNLIDPIKAGGRLGDELWPASQVAAAASRASRAIYVGWREPRLHDACSQLLSSAMAIPWLHVVEPWLPNVDRAYQAWKGDDRVSVEMVTIQEFMELGRVRPTDLVVWQHGPEHLELDAARALIRDMQLCGPRAIVLEVPDGDYPQGALGNNPFECHLSAWSAADLEGLGFRVFDSHEGAFLIAIWRPE